jgi:hypothetical protein
VVFEAVYKTSSKIGKLSQLLRLRRGDKGDLMGCSQSTAKEQDAPAAAVTEAQSTGNK